MNPIVAWKNQKLAEKMIEILEKKHYHAVYAETPEAAKKIILDMIPEGSTIGMGGSVTLTEMGMQDAFREGNYQFIDRFRAESWQAEAQMYREALLADYFVSSVGSITANGELVCTDSSGNRAAAMLHGPKNVIIVAGVNKFVDNLDEAFRRLKRIAPMNVKRLGHVTPCAESGVCENCDCDGIMCNYTSIVHHGRKHKGRITVIVVPEVLGF